MQASAIDLAWCLSVANIFFVYLLEFLSLCLSCCPDCASSSLGCKGRRKPPGLTGPPQFLGLSGVVVSSGEVPLVLSLCLSLHVSLYLQQREKQN